MRSRFDRAINGLVKGYFNNTLAKASCYGCAIGNIVAESLGANLKRSKILDAEQVLAIKNDGSSQVDLRVVAWSKVFQSGNFYQADGTIALMQNINENLYFGDAKDSIDATGYSWQELAVIEGIFEKSTIIPERMYCDFSAEQIDADQYNGLMAVVDALCRIEGITDPEPYKAMFNKSLQTV